jgi:hypothetical protein
MDGKLGEGNGSGRSRKVKRNEEGNFVQPQGILGTFGMEEEEGSWSVKCLGRRREREGTSQSWV